MAISGKRGKHPGVNSKQQRFHDGKLFKKVGDIMVTFQSFQLNRLVWWRKAWGTFDSNSSAHLPFAFLSLSGSISTPTHHQLCLFGIDE